MKRNFALGLFGGLIGLAVLGLLLGTPGSAGARGQVPSPVVARSDGPDGVHALSAAAPLTSTFSYQGQLKQNGAPVTNPACQIAFRLYDDPAVGSLIGSPLTPTVSVNNGLFTVGLNFGNNVFDGTARWLDMQVNCGSGFVPLTPRQPLAAVPYAFALPGLYTQPNPTSPNVIGGYSGNVISPTVVAGTISGGGASGAENRVLANYGTVGGGWDNTARGIYATVGGGDVNTASGPAATVGGGDYNTASNSYATVGGGAFNTASGPAATVGGGNGNTASGSYATVGGGNSNTASAYAATIGGGEGNTASGFSATIGGGGGNSASGGYATVPGGLLNTALGDYSFAAGNRAKANHSGAFVWADSTGAAITSTAPNQFLVRASGGITLYTNAAATVGAVLAPGSSSWSIVSDRNAKANFAAVDDRAVLAQLASMPIQTWNYSTQDASVRHIGPMAQDFYAAFNVGENNTTISSVDAQGVALAAIQGLVRENQDLKAQNTSLEARVSKLEQNAQPASFNAFNLLSVLACGGFAFMWIQQRRAKREDMGNHRIRTIDNSPGDAIISADLETPDRLSK